MSALDWSAFVHAVHAGGGDAGDGGLSIEELQAAGLGESEVVVQAIDDELETLSIAKLTDITLHKEANFQRSKASNWSGNPATDAHVRVFAKEKSGSMIGPWQREPGAAMEACPVVFLGSEGLTAVLAPDLASFAYLLLSGNHAYVWAEGKEMRFESLRPDATAVLAPGIDAEKARAALAEARALTPAFQALMQSLLPA